MRVVIIEDEKHLILTHNSIQQLDIVPNKNRQFKNKFNSLLSIVNKCSTCAGKRLFNHRILNPIIDVNVLNWRYNIIEAFRKKKDDKYVYLYFEEFLKGIIDLERYHRKITLKLLTPGELLTLDISCRNILRIIELVSSFDTIKNSNIIPIKKDILKFREFINFATKP